MCGLIAYFNTKKNDKQNVNKWVLETFEDQKNRGTNGFGIVTINKDRTYNIERSTEGYKFMYDIHANMTKMMIVHHRIPTSTPNLIAQTHPIIVSNGSLNNDYLIIHNGVINNDDELKTEHEEKLGFIYTTKMKEGEKTKFNDSECLAIEVARFIENQTNEIGTTGSAAFISIQINKKTQKVERLYFGRNEGNPLKIAKSRGQIKLSSEGQGNEVKPFLLYSCKIDENLKLIKRKMTFKTKNTTYEYYNNYYNNDRYRTWRPEKKEEAQKLGFGKEITIVSSPKKENDLYLDKLEKWHNGTTSKEDDIYDDNSLSGYEFLPNELSNEIEESREEIIDIVDSFVLDTAHSNELDVQQYMKEIYSSIKRIKELIEKHKEEIENKIIDEKKVFETIDSS